MIRSSAKRLRCTMVSVAQKRNSAMKSRSLTPSMLLGVMPAKPRSAASASAVDGEGVAGQRAAAQRHHVDARGQVVQPLGVALPGPGVAQQPVAPAHRLGRLQVGVAGHEQVDLGLGALHGDRDQLAQMAAQPRRSRRAATGARRWRPGRCGCARCAACPPRAPISSVSRRSLAVWISSSPSTSETSPAAHSSATRLQPGDELFGFGRRKQPAAGASARA